MKSLTHWYRLATIEDEIEGLTWYDDAYHLACELSEQTGYTVEQVAGVIAAYSINQGWSGNVTLVKRALLEGVFEGMKMVIKKVELILACDGDVDCILNILNGEKIKNFFLNIIGKFTGVTLDRWALRALGRSYDRATPLQYKKDAAKYKEIATKFGYSPAQFQAIIWVSVRKNWN